jgi:hypothetical protein
VARFRGDRGRPGRRGGGLYWMIPAVVASLIGGVINASLFLIKVPAAA